MTLMNSTDNTISAHSRDIADAAKALRTGDRVLLSGTVYTARDAAHMKLFELIDESLQLPFEMRGAIIYYAGPTPGGDRPVGSCGPTTSKRMDSFTPRLHDLGLSATIGKGERSAEVADAIARNGAVYFCAVGGAGALMSKHITAATEIAFPELGCESIKRLEVESMPLIVALDAVGGDIFKAARSEWQR